MNYLLFKADGSLDKQSFEYYIMQNSTGVDNIFVALADSQESDICQAVFTLPNNETNTLQGIPNTQTIDGVSYTGWLFTLTTAQTTYSGLLRMAVRVVRSTNQVLVNYPVGLIVNETGVMPDTDSGVTIEEINSYLVYLNSLLISFQEEYVTKEEAAPFAFEATKEISGCIVLDFWKSDIGEAKIKEFYDANSFPTGRYYIGKIHGTTEIFYLKYLSSTNVTLTFISVGDGGSYTYRYANNLSYNSSTTFYNIYQQATEYSDLHVVAANPSSSTYQIFQGGSQAIFHFFGQSKLFIGSCDTKVDRQVYIVEIESLAGKERWVKTLTYSEYMNSSVYSNILDGANRDDYEVVSHKVTSLSNLSTDTQYPSAKCVWDLSYNIREVAEGKCQTFVLSNDIFGIENGRIMYDTVEPMSAQPDEFYVYENGEWVDRHSELYNGDYDNLNIVNTMFKEDYEDIFVGETDGYIIMGTLNSTVYLYNVRGTRTDSGISHYPFKAGDIFLITELNVPDRWYDYDFEKYYKLETGKINLTNYPTKSGNETITGAWTFDNANGIVIKDSNVNYSTWSLKTTGYELGVYFGTNNKRYTFNFTYFYTQSIVPNDNNQNLGDSSNKWYDLYLSHNLTDGTNSYTIAESMAQFNVYDTGTNVIKWTKFYKFNLSSNTTFSLETAKTGCSPEYKAFIANTANSAITVTFNFASQILCNDDNIIVTNGNPGTLVLPAGVSIEVSIIGERIVAINFEAQ